MSGASRWLEAKAARVVVKVAATADSLRWVMFIWFWPVSQFTPITSDVGKRMQAIFGGNSSPAVAA
jgi:hypothetical protein